MNIRSRHIQLFVAAFLCLVNIHLTAQNPVDSQVLVRNRNPEDGLPAVLVKWIPPDLSGNSLVNIYRKEVGAKNWEKLNSDPWGKGVYAMPMDGLEEDKELYVAYLIAEEMKGDEEDADLAGLFLIIQTILNHDFAKYLGVQFDDETAIAGKKYVYEVKRLINGGEKSLGVSPVIKAGKFKPGEPVNFTDYLELDSTVKLRWDIPTDNRFWGVNIYRSDSGSLELVNPKPVVLPNDVTEGVKNNQQRYFYTDTGLKNGVVYEYVVRGIDAFGYELGPSPPIFAMPKDMVPPPKPFFVQAEADPNGSKQLILRWKWRDRNTDDVLGFIIRRRLSDSEDTTWTVLTKRPLSKDSREFVDEVPEYYQLFEYDLYAVDDSKNEAHAELAYGLVEDREPPAPPKGFSAVSDTGRVILKWAANEESDLEGYFVQRALERKVENGGKVTVVPSEWNLFTPSPIQETTFEDELPKKAKNRFMYRILAVDTSFNKSEPSEVATVQMPDVTPPEPPFISLVTAAPGEITVHWKPSFTSDLAGYRIERKMQADTSEWRTLNSEAIGPEETSYLDKTALSGVEYFYRLIAFDDSENRSEPSNQYLGMQMNTELSIKAQDLEAKWNAKKGMVQLKWKIEEAPELLGWMVYRKTGDQSPKPLSALNQDLDYIDKKVSPGATYTYEVRAFNKDGYYSRSETASLKIPIPEESKEK